MGLIAPRPDWVLSMEVLFAHSSPPWSNHKLLFRHTSFPFALCHWTLRKLSLQLIHTQAHTQTVLFGNSQTIASNKSLRTQDMTKITRLKGLCGKMKCKLLVCFIVCIALTLQSYSDDSSVLGVTHDCQAPVVTVGWPNLPSLQGECLSSGASPKLNINSMGYLIFLKGDSRYICITIFLYAFNLPLVCSPAH